MAHIKRFKRAHRNFCSFIRGKEEQGSYVVNFFEKKIRRKNLWEMNLRSENHEKIVMVNLVFAKK